MTKFANDTDENNKVIPLNYRYRPPLYLIYQKFLLEVSPLDDNQMPNYFQLHLHVLINKYSPDCIACKEHVHDKLILSMKLI